MSRPVQDPIEIVDGDKTSATHPAFGQIGASRVQGQTTLYGSDFVHHNYVTISIRRSELNRDLSHDWHFGKEELVQVALSEAQWATFVSSMNVGRGVPCTIEYVGREAMPSIPLRKQEDVVKKEFNNRVKELGALVAETIDLLDSEIGKSLSGVKRDKMLAHLVTLQRELAANMPFVADSFSKHMETTTERAKIEVNAYVTNMVNRAGLEALQGSQGPLQLNSGDEEK
jgi:hypothetical protein